MKLGLEKVPVHVAKDLTPDQIRAYRIADNQTASLATWDYDLLPIEIAGLKEGNDDLGLLGFDPDELAKLLEPAQKSCVPFSSPRLYRACRLQRKLLASPAAACQAVLLIDSRHLAT